MVTAVPRELERLILRCLRKEPERRYQTMLDVRNELQEIKEESRLGHTRRACGVPPAGVEGSRGARHGDGRGGRRCRSGRRGTFRPRARRARSAADGVVPLTSLNGLELGASLSPDGEQVAFSWNGEKQ